MAWIFEPEGTIGRQWHRLVGGASSWPHHPQAAVWDMARYRAHRLRGHRLLLTDGKPNNADHYERRYAVEDTRMAIREARDYFPYLFGSGAYDLPACRPLPGGSPRDLPTGQSLTGAART